MCAKKRCDVARSLRPTIPMRPPPLFPVTALPVGHPRVSFRQDGVGQALISCFCPLDVISMRRGLAFSATGMWSVSTPAS